MISHKRASIFAANFILLVFSLPIFVSTVNAGVINDVIIFKNGDRLTGEIKRMGQGSVYFKNARMYETIRLDWEKIERIITDRHFIISLSDNTRFTGSIEKDVTLVKGKEGLKVKTDTDSFRLEPDRIIELMPVEKSFFQQFHVDADLGFSLARAENQRSLTTSLEVERFSRKWNISTTLDTSLNSRNDVDKISRNSLTFASQYFFSRNWFIPAIAQFQSSSEQSLDLRTSFGGGIGRYLKRTNRTVLFVTGGLVGTRERYDPIKTDQPKRSSLEAVGGIGYTTFRFDKTRFDTTFLVFPSISDPGHYRTDLRTNLRFNIVGDLYWTANFYANYDNRPPMGTSAGDYGLTTGIGWSFK